MTSTPTSAIIARTNSTLRSRHSSRILPTFIMPATATQIGEAIRIGPGLMPVFDEDNLSEQDVNSIAAYLHWLRDNGDEGGAQLGRVGAVGCARRCQRALATGHTGTFRCDGPTWLLRFAGRTATLPDAKGQRNGHRCEHAFKPEALHHFIHPDRDFLRRDLEQAGVKNEVLLHR